MKRLSIIVAFFLMLCAVNAYAQHEYQFLGVNTQLWSDANNWADGVKPDQEEAIVFLLSSVLVDEDVIVKNLVYDASEVSVTVAAGCKLTVYGLILPFEEQSLAQKLIVEDGAQLLYGHSVEASVRMKCSPYHNTKESAAWHFIASPLASPITPAALDSLTPEQVNYELMRFNQSDVGNEWERYKDEAFQDSFQLANGQGYLYAIGSEVTVSFVGEILPNDQPVSVGLEYDGASAVVAKGLNLVGNPFTCEAYSNRSYYKMNVDGDDVELVRASANEPIAPSTGMMVQAYATGQSVGFSRTPYYDDKGCIRLTLKSNGEIVDETFLSFNEGDEIGKFNFVAHEANLYFQQDGRSLAIGFAELPCQKAVHFKASENGNFTLTVTPENANITSLYLVDNITGADINLLASPSYSFSASTSDFVSRFKLFVNTDHGVGESHEEQAFAYYSNGEIVLQDMEGETVLEIIDVTGRVILRRDALNASQTIPTGGMASGIYILRLTEGRAVRTQKMVVW